jgi:hypothetical protein
MSTVETRQVITKLYMELSDAMCEYSECVKRDDFFEIKRKLLGRIRVIEKQINDLNQLEAKNYLRY